MNFMEKYFLNFSLSLDHAALSLRKLRSGHIIRDIRFGARHGILPNCPYGRNISYHRMFCIMF